MGELTDILDQAIIDGQDPDNHATAVAKALKAIKELQEGKE